MILCCCGGRGVVSLGGGADVRGAMMMRGLHLQLEEARGGVEKQMGVIFGISFFLCIMSAHD